MYIIYKDLKQTLNLWQLWFYLAWMDVKLRYRRSSLGPWWITLSMVIFIGALGAIYSKLLKQDPANYLPFLATGYLFWVFMATCVTESSEIFIQSQDLIKQIRIPYILYVMRCLSRNAIILAHNLVVYLFVVIYFEIPVGWVSLLVIPGFLLVFMNIFWVSLFLSMVGSRFRDIPPIITSLTTLLFFISPITWMPKLLESNTNVIKYNPVTYLLDITRSPLLGQLPDNYSWVVVASICFGGFITVFLLYSRCRYRIPFWVG